MQATRPVLVEMFWIAPSSEKGLSGNCGKYPRTSCAGAVGRKAPVELAFDVFGLFVRCWERVARGLDGVKIFITLK